MSKTPAWQRKEGQSASGGLNAAGRRSYERENPGSDLKPPVKKAKTPEQMRRQGSFLVRMASGRGPLRDSDGELTRKGLSIKKWGGPLDKQKAIAKGRSLLNRAKQAKETRSA